jgi:hypothetical protein
MTEFQMIVYTIRVLLNFIIFFLIIKEKREERERRRRGVLGDIKEDYF